MNELTAPSANDRRSPLAYIVIISCLAIGLLLLWWPVPSQAQATLGVKQTVGTATNLCPATTALAVAANTTVHFCVTLTNPTNALLTDHTFVLEIPQLALTRAFSFTTNLPPGQSVAVNTSYLAALDQLPSPSPLSAAASASFTSIVTATSTADNGTTARGAATAQVVIGSVGLQLTKTVGTAGNSCGTARGLAVSANTTVYYCVTLTKSGNLSLVRHRLVDPALGVDVTFTDPITTTTGRVYTSERVRALQPPTELTKNITQSLTNTVTVTSYTPEGIEVSAQGAAHVIVGSAAISVTNTVGATAGECAPTSNFAVAANATVYHCVRIINRGTIPLTRHQVTIPLLGLNSAVTQTLRAGEVLTITSSTLPQLRRVVAAAETSNVTVASTSAHGIVANATATAQVSLGAATLTVTKYPQRDPNSCAKNTALNVVSNEQFYYCLVVRNSGQLPLVTHSFSEPNLQISGRFSYTLGAGQLLTLTNQFLVNTLKVNPSLGPLRTQVNITNQLNYSARAATGAEIPAIASAASVSIIFPSVTPTTAPTIAPTLSPTPTPSPTISPTPIPTPTPTTVVLSFPATPTSAFNLNSIETPTPGVVGGAQNPNFNSPVETPFFPTPDYVATTFALTAEAAATQTSFAFLPTSPIPTAIETPTPPLPIPTDTPPVASPTPTPLVAIVGPPTLAVPSPTPAPIADYLNLVAGMLAVSTATLGWIWFLVGSIIFFAVAGLFAGLTFRQQERHRYADAEEEEPLPLFDESALAGSGSLYYMTDDAGDGYTVATSRPVAPSATDDWRYARDNDRDNSDRGSDWGSNRHNQGRDNELNNQSDKRGRNQPAPDDLESDDFWPASLR